MEIYNRSGQLVLDVDVDDESYRYRAIMGDNNLTLKYALAEHVELPVGSYCEYQGERYTLERPESFKMQHSRYFDYTVTFEAYQAKAKIWKFRNPVDGRLKFPLTAKPIEHLQMFVDNMNRRDSGWTVGDCIGGVEHLISYDHDYCWDALTKMATEFDTEFEIVGKRVSLHRVEYNKSNPLPLSYGRGNGFKAGLGRDKTSNSTPVEILYAQGGDRNIDRSKYCNSELLLPKGQTIGYDGVHFEDETGYNSTNARKYIVDDLGLSIRRADKDLSTLAEDSIDCSDIYPKRVGTVSSVIEVNADKHFYDFCDDSIPDGLNYEDCIIAGEKPTVIFQSGILSGREFEVKYYHDEKTVGGVKKSARRFEIVPQEIDGITMPDSTFKPRTGDTYAVFKVMLPLAYIRDNTTKSGAEWEMFRKAVKYMFDNEEQKYTFTGELDGIWAKKDWANIGGRIVLGGYILFTDERFQKKGVLLRITAIKDYVNKPHSPAIELSNDTVGSSFAGDIKKLESTEVLIDSNHRDALQYTKRRFRDAQETMSMLESSLLENFTGSVTPITVQTMAMLVGDESLQFRFVNSRATPQPASHSFIYDKDTKQLTTAGGIIQHLTLGISSISSDHAASDYKFWDVSSYTSSRLDDGDRKYYLYIRASKSAQTAEFVLSEAAIKMEGVNGYYHFLVGLLNSEYDGERNFVTLYGYTEVLPGRVTTDRVVSGDGQSYFDMAGNALKLGSSGSGYALDYNSQGDGKLRLRGTLVQSESGNESYLGCFRGEYNSSYTYYNGDEVTYTYEGDTSTYRYVHSTAGKGHAPTDTLYWQVIAAGSKGADGTSVKIIGQAAGHYSTMAEARAKLTVETIKYGTGDSAHARRVGQYGIVDTNEDEPEQAKKSTWYAYRSPNGAMNVGGEEDGSLITYKANAGDGFILKSTGHLYIANDTGWQDVGLIKGDKGDAGATGATGNYTELRFAINGSTSTPPALDTAALDPSGWSTATPTVGKGEYMWVTHAVKTGDGKSLVSGWSVPYRATPQDGQDGKNGDSPVMVYRGVYDSSKTYYGNNSRLDCVKHGTEYYIARIDAGEFSSPAPPDASKWNDFGANFESIATNLLLAEGANIGDWFISEGKIVSTLDDGNKIELDAKKRTITIYSSSTGGDYIDDTENRNINTTLKLDADNAVVEVRNDNGVSYMSSSGILANRAGTQCVDATTGMTHKAAVCGIGRGNLAKSPWEFNKDEALLAGVYGYASNYGTAPSYGGYFYNLKVNGLCLNTKYIDSSGVYLTDSHSYIVGLTNVQSTVYLPASSRQGQTILFKQIGTGYMRVYPRSGQRIYDDNTVNDYYDVNDGQMMLATFTTFYQSTNNTYTKIEAWLVSRMKF